MVFQGLVRVNIKNWDKNVIVYDKILENSLKNLFIAQVINLLHQGRIIVNQAFNLNTGAKNQREVKPGTSLQFKH